MCCDRICAGELRKTDRLPQVRSRAQAARIQPSKGWLSATMHRIDKKTAFVELSDHSGIQWGHGMTRWCLIVALVFAAPGCHRQVRSDELSARSVGIRSAPAAISSERLPDTGGAESKDRPDDNSQFVNSSSPEGSKETATSAPVPVPAALSDNEQSEPAAVAAPVARTPPPPLDLPAAAPSRRALEIVRNSVPTAARRDPTPVTTDPVNALIERGDAMLALHDIGSARLLYERAAKAGNSRAATGVGKTYDPNYLRMEGAVGLQPNRSEAITWYQKAAALGDTEAETRLRQLQN
jgi:hypothetical protein